MRPASRAAASVFEDRGWSANEYLLARKADAVSQHEKNLDLLGVFQYAYAALVGTCCACYPAVYVLMGTAMLSGKIESQSSGGPDDQAVGSIVVVMGIAGVLMVWAKALLALLAGWNLRRRRHRTFCMVVGALECLNMPLGTILGVFTIVVLSNEHVRALFDAPPGGGWPYYPPSPPDGMPQGPAPSGGP